LLFFAANYQPPISSAPQKSRNFGRNGLEEQRRSSLILPDIRCSEASGSRLGAQYLLANNHITSML
jgi:hypothetical protein